MRTGFRIAAALAAVLSTLLAAAPASAQYFGRNKVQYKDLRFEVLETEHFDIYFYPEERAGVEISARLAERWRARLARVFGHELRGRQPLVLYASHADFEQTNVIQGELSEGTGGVTEGLRRRIVLPLGGPLADTDHVIGHELVHAFQFDLTSGPNATSGMSGADRLPLWFIEGMAEYLSVGPVDPNTAMWLRDAVQHDELPTIDTLNDPKYFPYRWGQAFWAYVGGRWGDAVIRRMFAAAAASGDVEVACEKVLEVKKDVLSKDWQAAIRQAYAPVIASATPADRTARLVIKGAGLGGDLNIGPAISPDGRWIAFLSSRELFSIELYVAETATGRVVRRLTSTASNPHFTSLQFIYSAGAWDRTSRRLAVATIVSGRPVLAIFDVESGRTEREVPIRDVDEIFNPTWAPDGSAVAFTGMRQGLTDLYVYDLAASHLRRLTDDAYAELQPAWSPDGRRIAFATDRFTTDLPSLAMGTYRLALADVDTGRIDPLPAAGDSMHINPQWSPDGRLLYFVANPGGISNLFRIELASGSVTQLTSVATGLSGITQTSPAASIASQTGAAAFSVYEDGQYNIYVAEPGKIGAARAAAAGNAAVLPPIDRRPSDVAALLDNATFGLPESPTYPTRRYAPKLSLEAVGQPMIAIGASRFGPAFGGGVAFAFGDMLGNHSLVTAVEFSSGIGGNFSAKDTAAQVGYFNQARRWNWGVVAGQVPYLSGGFQIGTGTMPDGEPVQVDRTIIYRQTERNASAMAAYPLSRSRRFELSGGVTQVAFDQIVRTTAYSLSTGEVVLDDTSETSLAQSLTLGTSAAAFVNDTSSFGATSPVRGERYRIEAAPTFGSVSFTSVLGDYRRYFMPLPFYTLAVRGLHYGRYGGGGEDPRLYPLYIGYPTLVRGYDVNSFDATECVPDATSQCPAFDRLLGSRMLVGNIEFRFPLLRPFGVSQRMYGPLPVELALFADGGVAWSSGEKPAIFGGTRHGVSSVGVTVRLGFGVAVGQFDFVRPMQRPGQGWIFQFNLAPGF
ncbi:MAG: peptidase S9 [Betaproteobacteria bacterium]